VAVDTAVMVATAVEDMEVEVTAVVATAVVATAVAEMVAVDSEEERVWAVAPEIDC
jgi:hypothetical protein